MKQYKVGSLFAGVGGICLGFKQAKYKNTGYKIEWSNEIDKYAAFTYRMNFDQELILGDVEKIVKLERCQNKEELKKYKEKQKKILNYKIDILNAGFPCQAFSISGERKGFDDHRGNLFFSIIDLIYLLDKKQKKPRILFLENVKNLKSHDEGKTYKTIKKELESVGYIIKEAVLNTMKYSNLPQNRERIYILGFLYKEDAEKFTMFDNLKQFEKLKKTNQKIDEIKKNLDLNLTKKELEKYYYTKEKYPNYFLTEEEYNKIPKENRKDIRINLDEKINEKYQFYQVRRGMYIRKNMNGVCPTLTANMGTGGHNVPLIKVKDGIRKLTPKETFKLQGFPIGNGYDLPEEYDNRSFSDGRLYKQAGNSVSVDIIKLIAEQILKVLE